MKRSRLGNGAKSLARGSTFCRNGRVYVTQMCEDCGAEFERRSDWAATSWCRSCTHKRQRRRVTVECENCGVSFEAKASESARGKAKFCSFDCSYATSRISSQQYETIAANLAEERRGEGNPNYKHGRSARDDHRPGPNRWSVKVKGERFCRNCGNEAVHLHHIVPRSRSRRAKDNVEHNGMPLCGACHMGWHGREVTIFQHWMTDAEFAFVVQLVGSAWVERNYPDPPLSELLTLYYAKTGRWLDHSSGTPEPLRVRTSRLCGLEWLPEPSIVGLAA